MSDLMEKEREFERWFKRNNERIGEITVPQLGEYPPNINNFYGSLLNEYVTTDLIRHYADGIGDRNPLWRRPEYARSSVWGGIIAPPTFTDSIIQGYPYKFEPEQFAKFNNFMQCPNGSTRELLRPIRPGDKMHALHRYNGMHEVASVYDAPVREFDESVRREIYNQNDELVAVITTHNHAFLNYEMGPDNPVWGKRELFKITDEQRQRITEGYDSETRRGADTLYYEDVELGSTYALHPIGPISPYDVTAFYTAMPGHAVAFEIEWERIKIFPEFGWIDPETNMWTSNGVCHLQNNKGHAFVFDGGPALGFYHQVEGVLGRMLCNWMGDAGFVKLLDTHSPINCMHSDVLCCSLQVTGKKVADGECLVDLDVLCKNWEESTLVMSTGKAQVRLPSRHNVSNPTL